MHITLRQLTVFNAVARHLSYTRAAAELHLTQPAVSLQVRHLEDAVGLALFEQIGKKIYLTEAGHELLRYERAIFDQLDEAREMLAQMKDASRGTLDVAVATTASSFATRLLAGFMHRFPNAGISVDVTNRETLLRQLENNEKDLVIMGRPPDDMDLCSQAFMDNPLVVIATPEHPLVGHKAITLKTLAGEPFVMRERASGTRAAMERLFTHYDLHPIVRTEISSNEAIKQAVAAGLGVAVVSRHTLELELMTGRVAVLDVEHFPIKRQWHLVYRNGKRLSPIAQAFQRFVDEEASHIWSMYAPPAVDETEVY